MFVCNSSNRHEVNFPHHHIWEGPAWLIGWQPRVPFRYCGTIRESEEKPESIMLALECVVQYSGRTLSYDLDALDAFIGVLEVFKEDCIYHIWGLLFCQVSCKIAASNVHQKAYFGLALLWLSSQHWTPA